jgi:MFS family permease
MNSRYRQILTALYIAGLTFFAYTSVFAFRKPFTVATFEGERFFGISYQTTLIVSQVIGYMLAKFAGIRFISGLKRSGRWITGTMLVFTAWLALLLFAILPPWAGIICFLVNGFMMGFMWGVVFSYAEGRRSTDFIGSVLAVSFIFAGGFTRSVGKWLMVDYGITEKWMPFMTGLVFVVPLAVLFYLLEHAPAPTSEDIQEREERVSMSSGDRKKILRDFGKGMAIIAVVYMVLTVIRDIRDNYMGNMWTELGHADDVSVYARSETRITVIILVLMSLLVLVRRNMLAFRLVHIMILGGFILAGISSLLFVNDAMEGSLWMQTVGLGLYLAYIPFNAIFFERMIATFRIRGNVGFLIYLTDAFGYLGSVTVMLTKEMMDVQLTWSVFFSYAVLGASVLGVLGTLYALFYFNRRYSSAPAAGSAR